jgi:hypothetical protein
MTKIIGCDAGGVLQGVLSLWTSLVAVVHKEFGLQ